MWRETYSRAGAGEGGFVTSHGVEALGELVDSRLWVEHLNIHPSRGRNDEWAKERKPGTKTERWPGLLCAWASAQMGGWHMHGSVSQQCF